MSERFWVDDAYRRQFERRGLRSVGDVLSAELGQCLRRLPDRENWRWELPDERGAVAAYVKKHHARLRRLGWRRIDPAGLHEAERIAELAELGLTAMRLVAYGAEVAGRRDRSFVITQELAGYEPLDDFLRRFPPRRGGERRDARFDALLSSVAEVAARFHRHGYNHRDFYACHFFVRERDRGEFDVSLIDLQRVERRDRFRRRWIVKDLAQLAYSLPRDRVGCVDRVRFLRRYLGASKLTAAHHRLIRAVLAKEASMRRGERRSHASPSTNADLALGPSLASGAQE